ncbi:DUF5919 domain-containing protein [Nocardioides aquiterrae]|uniref:DUF5919 domain-containing protein n=1 Tax=Nocardioides aquiterrae TaxID=203799 RepID=A0ABP4FBH2_9ACTN
MSRRDFYINLLLNLLASILFAVIVLALGKLNVIDAVFLGCGFVAGIILAYIVRGAFRTSTPGELETGITEIYAAPNEGVELMFSGAEHSIDFWGVSANRTGRSVASRDAMLRVGRNGGQIRFLLLNPDSPHLARRAADEGEDPEPWRTEIRGTVTRLKAHAHQHGYSLEVRYFDAYPVWRMVTIDRDRMTLNWFLPGRPGHHSPTIMLSGKPDLGVFKAFKREFEERWNEADPA